MFSLLSSFIKVLAVTCRTRIWWTELEMRALIEKEICIQWHGKLIAFASNNSLLGENFDLSFLCDLVTSKVVGYGMINVHPTKTDAKTWFSTAWNIKLPMIKCMLCIFNIQGSPDLKAAREVADYLGTRHHEFHFTVQVIPSVLRLKRASISTSEVFK